VQRVALALPKHAPRDVRRKQVPLVCSNSIRLDILPALQIGVIQHGPTEELERLAPRVHKFGQSVAVGVPHLTVGKRIATEDRAPRPDPLDQYRVKSLRSCSVVRMVRLECRKVPRTFIEVVNEPVAVAVHTVITNRLDLRQILEQARSIAV